MIKNIFRIFFLFCLLFTAVIFSACATGPVIIQNTSDDFKALKNGKIGIAFYAPEKRVEFAEQIYLVIGYAMKESYHSYEGIWDPMPILKDKVFSELNIKYFITPISLSEIMTPDQFANMSQTLENNYKQKRMRVSSDGVFSSWEKEYQIGHHNKFLKEKLPEYILGELKSLNIDYFLEVYLGSISYKDPTMFDWINCTVVTYSRLNRVSDASIIWLNKSIGATILKNIQSLTELEK
jgi:hypothetical protein